MEGKSIVLFSVVFIICKSESQIDLQLPACSISDLPVNAGISCISDEQSDIYATGLVPRDTKCQYKCASSNITRHVLCGGKNWIGEVECKANIDVFHHTDLLQRRKRFLPFHVPIYGIICMFARCGHQRPRDRNPPTLQCPPNIHADADPIQVNTVIRWTIPSANDDVDGPVTVRSADNQQPGILFSEGGTDVRYFSNDKSGNQARCHFTVYVRVIRCRKMGNLKDGYAICHPSDDMRRGASCRFGCYRGHKLKGTSLSKCMDSGRWNFQKPFCEKITCPPLQEGDHIHVSCTNSNNFRSACSFSCSKGFGFQPHTKTVRVCQATGTWSDSTPSCVDTEPPVFEKCPSLHHFYVPENKEATYVSWDTPIAKDNVDVNIPVTKLDGPSFSSKIKPGVYTVKYSAEDSSGNKATPCQFRIIVKQIRCSPVYPTPFTSVACSGIRYGATCRFDCTDGAELNGRFTVKCDQTSDPPYGFWTWNNTQPFCELKEKCIKPSAPANGALACDRWLGGQFCQMQCQNGYDIPNRPGNYFPKNIVCSDDGAWTLETTLSNCMESKPPRGVRTHADFYYYGGTCEMESTKLEIKQNFITAIQHSYFVDSCTEPKGCIFRNVDVICGKHRQKRSVSTMNIRVHLFYPTLNSTEETYVRIFEQNNQHMQLLENVIVKGNGTMLFSGLKHNPVKLSYFEESPLLLECPDNMASSYKSFSCVECGKGTFYDNESDSCITCPRGTYQSHTGKTKCTQCPANKSTAQIGSTSTIDCIDSCLPGSYSDTSVPPCTACDVGTYQNLFGAVSCNECPGTKLTASDSSVSEDECQDFDISFPSNESVGVILQNAKVTLSSDFILKTRFKCSNRCSGDILELTDRDNTTVMTLSLHSGIRVQYHGSVINTNATEIEDGKWHSLSIVYNKTSLYFFVDGVHQTNLELEDHGVSYVDNIVLGYMFGGQISQLNIYSSKNHQSLKIMEPVLCTTEKAGDVLNWKDFRHANLHLAFVQIPSLCDDLNECETSPCLHGQCVDNLHQYDCLCDKGFTGRDCDVNIDNCVSSTCQNNATCVDGVDGYTCSCPPLFTGQLCEIAMVNGKWSAWNDWSVCSVTCGNGTRQRVRTCTDPAPDNGGLECDGDGVEIGFCSKEACRECTALVAPEYSALTCQNEGNMTYCTLKCDEGYDFDHAPPDNYSCGNDTFYVWDFKTEDNAYTKLPNCIEISDADSITIDHTAFYTELACDDDAVAVRKTINDKLERNSANISCVQSGTCNILKMTATECKEGRTKRDVAPITIGYTVKLQCSPKDLGTKVCYKYLNMAIRELLDLGIGNAMTINLDQRRYKVNQSSLHTADDIECPDATVPVYVYCVPCGVGRYYDSGECKLCARGYYQDETKQRSCKSCKYGYTTEGTGSWKEDNCNGMKIYFVVLFSCIGVLTIAMTIICFIIKRKNRHKY